MDRYQPYTKAKSRSGYKDMPGLGRVPTDPGRSGERHGRGSNSGSVKSTDEKGGRRKQAYNSSMRRPSPVRDHRTTKRQSYIPSAWVKFKAAAAPHGSHSALPAPKDTTPQRPPTGAENRSRGRRGSPELFVRQDHSDHESDDDADDDSNDDIEHDGTEADTVGDYEISSDDDDSGEEALPAGEDSGTCICPINLQCPKRANNLLDCRTLVPDIEWSRWIATTQPQFNDQLNTAVPPVAANFTTIERVNKFFDHCERLKRHPTPHASDRSDYRRMVEWAIEMQRHSITQTILAATQILPQLQAFLTPANINQHLQKRTPLNLREELDFIREKWARGDLLADANRGIIRTIRQTANRGLRYSEKIDPQWQYRKSDNFYGHGHLKNGQRWLSRFQMSRDGAHGAPQAGICGTKKLGARSIVMGYHDERRNEYYADVDKGWTIWYVGTALSDLNIVNDPEPKETNIKDTAASSNRRNRSPTNATQALMKSRQTRTPVRVFRSYYLANIVSHKPKEGFRYDGLYRVVGWECLKLDRQIYRFKMRRLRRNDPEAGGQGPLRGVRRST